MAITAALEREERAIEFKATAVDDQARSFEGYGSVFGVEDAYGDVVMPGAFKGTLARYRAAGRLPAMLWQHDSRSPIGIWEEMREDPVGLYVRGRTADTAFGRDVYELLKLGALTGLSIGFQTRAAEWPEGDQADGPRRLTEIELWEVSPVTFPANDAARITEVRLRAAAWSERELEARLCRVGLSRRQAKGLLAAGWRGFLRDADPTPSRTGARDATLSAAEAEALIARFAV